MRRLAFSAVLFLFAVSTAPAAEPITIGETVTIRSDIMDEERTLLVSTPPGYEQSGQSYPVLYMTDGDTHLTHTRGTVDFLVRNGLMPPVIIVGVTNTDRTRDLSPTNATTTNDDGTVREFPTSGGASNFLDFFERELSPYIDSHYRTLPYRLFSGHSFGGLFALAKKHTDPAPAAAIAVLISSALFSCAHYLGSEPFHIVSFTYRFLAGMLFCALFWFRGFAVAVYTHTIYDIYVLVGREMLAKGS